MVQNLLILCHNDTEFYVEAEHRWGPRVKLLVSGIGRQDKEEMEIKFLSILVEKERHLKEDWSPSQIYKHCKISLVLQIPLLEETRSDGIFPRE